MWLQGTHDRADVSQRLVASTERIGFTMGVIWNKVWFDLWHFKVRTLLAVLSIAAGVFAVGAMFGMADELNTTLDASHRAVIAPHLDMRLAAPIDRDTALAIRKVPGVEGVQPLAGVGGHGIDPFRLGRPIARRYLTSRPTCLKCKLVVDPPGSCVVPFT